MSGQVGHEDQPEVRGIDPQRAVEAIMAEEGKILGVPFKLERRSVQDQIFEVWGRVGIVEAGLKHAEERLKAIEAVAHAPVALDLEGIRARLGGLELSTGTQLQDIEGRLKWLENFARHRPAGEAYLSERDYGVCPKPGSSWSKELPMKPGFYWWRLRAIPKIQEPCEVRFNSPGGQLCVAVLGITKPSKLSDAEGEFEWYGPIEPPE